jgi:hypothetical protein
MLSAIDPWLELEIRGGITSAHKQSLCRPLNYGQARCV